MEVVTLPLDRAASIVDGIPLDRRVVLLGESTHGTQEFYATRAEVTKRLIRERGFSVVMFEGDWPAFQLANEYVHGRRATPFASEDARRFPSWMWHNEATLDLLSWCRAQPTAPTVCGCDCYSLFESKAAVIGFLERVDAAFAADVRQRLALIDKYDSGFAYADAMVNGPLSRVAEHIVACYATIQARLQWGADKYACTDAERLSAEQNMEVVIAADEYYRKCVSEPRGSNASWNIRDQVSAGLRAVVGAASQGGCPARALPLFERRPVKPSLLLQVARRCPHLPHALQTVPTATPRPPHPAPSSSQHMTSTLLRIQGRLGDPKVVV